MECVIDGCTGKAEVQGECIACINKAYDLNHRPASEKRCTTCNKSKLLSEFLKHRGQCKVCYRKKKRIYGLETGRIKGVGQGNNRVLIKKKKNNVLFVK